MRFSGRAEPIHRHMTASSPSKRRRQPRPQPKPRFSSRPARFNGECVVVYGDDTHPSTRMFPELPGESVTDAALWTPTRLRVAAAA